jgi:SH3 domain protein
VTDVLYVNLRTEQGDTGRTLRTIRSGTPLEILERSQTDDKFVRVRTEDGLEGWVNDRFLTGEAIAATRIKQMEDSYRQMQKENQQLKEKFQKIDAELREKDKDHQRLASENTKLSSQFHQIQQVSARPIELEQENKDLRLRAAELQKEVVDLRNENSNFKDSTNRNWFLTGSAVVILGVLIGLVVPRLRFRRQSSWA